MTEAAQLALIAAIPNYISSLTALVMALVAYKQFQRNAEEKAESLDVAQTVAAVKEDTGKIKVSTDGGLTDVKNELKSVNEQNKTITEQNLVMQATITTLGEAIAKGTNQTKRVTGELIEEVKNGSPSPEFLKELTELKELLVSFKKEGMPVITPDDMPLPVKVEQSEKP